MQKGFVARSQAFCEYRQLTPGAVATIVEVTVIAVPAYNLNTKYHPKAKGWPGFIVEIEGVRVYHAGDTDFIPEMKDLQVDIALLPVSGSYVMTAAEAIYAAQAIKPRAVSFPGITERLSAMRRMPKCSGMPLLIFSDASPKKGCSLSDSTIGM